MTFDAVHSPSALLVSDEAPNLPAPAARDRR
jgi:hypothetical protein